MNNDQQEQFTVADELAFALNVLVRSLPNDERLADYAMPLDLAESAIERYRQAKAGQIAAQLTGAK